MPIQSQDREKRAAETIAKATEQVCASINEFTSKVFRTRGGRVGSGMGALMEALWGYYMNHYFDENRKPYEIAWLETHEYNDFVCLEKNKEWDPKTRHGELLRIEAKSMNLGVAESKAHFDEIVSCLRKFDLLLVLIWKWDRVDEYRVSPLILDFFVGNAIEIALLRDKLHLARGGSFIQRGKCPDGCTIANCSHVGEPLNSSGKRERLSGPNSRRPSSNVSFAANFGGLVRMLKTETDEARKIFRKIRASNEEAHRYISFIYRNFPAEEQSQYLLKEWREVAAILGIEQGGSKEFLIQQIRGGNANYPDVFRMIRS